MIPLFQNDNILDINIIAIQKLQRNTQKQTTYHLQKNLFHLIYFYNNKIKVCFFISKKIDYFIQTYILNGPNFITLHLNLLNQYIHLYNLYHPVNLKEISTNITILAYQLVAFLNKEYLILKNLTFMMKLKEDEKL